MRALLSCCFVAIAACSAGSGNPDGGNACPAPTGAGTNHGDTISADETWTAAASPHIVTSAVKVATGATLTIEPCAVVKLKSGAGIEVDGHLTANGTATQPITFDAADATQPWNSLRVFGPGTLTLAYATVNGGGSDTTNSYGLIEARGDQTAAAQPILKVDHVTVTGAAAYGVSLRSGGAFTADSQALTISGAKTAPLRIVPRLASNIPSGSYTGNMLDAIVVETEAYGDITLEDVTFHERGVPYVIGLDKTAGDLVVGTGSTLTTLTVEAGAVLKFKKPSGALHVDSGSSAQPAHGALVARGTAAKPVVFTSAAATPAAGDWLGIAFGNQPDSHDALDHVEIRYAGGPSQANSFHCMPPTGALSQNEDAALTVYGQPASAFLTNSLIADSAALGVNLAYHGTFVDFTPTNTFTGVASCKVSTPRASDGSCPSTVMCP